MIEEELGKLCDESSLSEVEFYAMIKAVADEKLEEGSYKDSYLGTINEVTSDVVARMGFESSGKQLIHDDITDVNKHYMNPRFNFRDVPANKIPEIIFREGLNIGERALRDEFRKLLRIRR